MKKLFFALLFLTTKIAVAQTAATNTGILFITGSADTIYAGSDFTNNSGSAFTNHGQFRMKGTLTNNQSAMTAGTGTLYLYGSSAQNINGSQAFKTYHLTTNNNAGITLNNNLSVSGVHTFTSGIVATSATPNYLIYEAGSSYAGDGDTRHVNGWVKKFGSTNFIFPVGNGTVERTVALSSLSASSEFSAKYFSNTPDVNQRQAPIWNVDNAEYWSIQKTYGGSASVTMNWDYSKVYFPNYIVADIRTTGYDGSFWVNYGGTATGSSATTGTITSGSTSSFNLFTFGSQSYVLPLTLISFNAMRQDTYTQISWTTEKEYDAGHFFVERSDNGSFYYVITQLPARNSGITEHYSTRDNTPIHHIAYYRLRFKDANGHERFSKTMAVTSNADARLTLLVNPVHDNVMLVATPALKGLFNYKITAMNGQSAQQGKLMIQNGGLYQLGLKRNLVAGQYILEVSNGPESFHFKLIVQ